MRLLQIKNISVIGAGIMGHGIAQTFALGGYEVTLNDISDALLNKAVHQIRSNLKYLCRVWNDHTTRSKGSPFQNQDQQESERSGRGI